MNGRAIGFVGLGEMGASMATRLCAPGEPELVVHDIRPGAAQPLIERGAKMASCARDVADSADIVFACLPDNDACRAAILGSGGVIEGRRATLLVNLGTTGAVVASELEVALRKRGLAFMDAPVSGGTTGAAEGTLAVMVSGPRDEFTRIESLLRRLGTTIEYIGDKPGQAQTLKLLNNLLSTTAFLVTGEAMVMGVKAGLDPEVMLRVINAGSGRNSATAEKFPRAVLTRTFYNGSSTSVSAKDTKLCLEEAAALGVPMWIGSAVRQFYEYALAQGAGTRDRTTLVQYLEQVAGVEIPKTR